MMIGYNVPLLLMSPLSSSLLSTLVYLTMESSQLKLRSLRMNDDDNKYNKEQQAASSKQLSVDARGWSLVLMGNLPFLRKAAMTHSKFHIVQTDLAFWIFFLRSSELSNANLPHITSATFGIIDNLSSSINQSKRRKEQR